MTEVGDGVIANKEGVTIDWVTVVCDVVVLVGDGVLVDDDDGLTSISVWLRIYSVVGVWLHIQDGLIDWLSMDTSLDDLAVETGMCCSILDT